MHFGADALGWHSLAPSVVGLAVGSVDQVPSETLDYKCARLDAPDVAAVVLRPRQD
jgi:hypothetical protein